mmetsp:Transcript_6075/g.17682  ORF Transcript_6075/g.17682 Transcript_6075/m.17682 type:complete len:205 (-) Transcript_6075:905-1519(-)
MGGGRLCRRQGGLGGGARRQCREPGHEGYPDGGCWHERVRQGGGHLERLRDLGHDAVGHTLCGSLGGGGKASALCRDLRFRRCCRWRVAPAAIQERGLGTRGRGARLGGLGRGRWHAAGITAGRPGEVRSRPALPGSTDRRRTSRVGGTRGTEDALGGGLRAHVKGGASFPQRCTRREKRGLRRGGNVRLRRAAARQCLEAARG